MRTLESTPRAKTSARAVECAEYDTDFLNVILVSDHKRIKKFRKIHLLYLGGNLNHQPRIIKNDTVINLG